MCGLLIEYYSILGFVFLLFADLVFLIGHGEVFGESCGFVFGDWQSFQNLPSALRRDWDGLLLFFAERQFALHRLLARTYSGSSAVFSGRCGTGRRRRQRCIWVMKRQLISGPLVGRSVTTVECGRHGIET